MDIPFCKVMSGCTYAKCIAMFNEYMDLVKRSGTWSFPDLIAINNYKKYIFKMYIYTNQYN